MDRAWLNAEKREKFFDPSEALVALRKIEGQIANADLPPKIRNLRGQGQKGLREFREAALFCEGMSVRVGQQIFFRMAEAQDYDFVASWVVESEQHFATVQLKEVVPKHLNPEASLEKILAALSKYTNSENLTVAIHLNQIGHFEPSEVIVPPLKLAALWVFSAISEDQSEWGLWGNFLEAYEGVQYRYPSIQA